MTNLKTQIAELLHNQIPSLTIENIFEILEVPANTQMGDYAFPCFKLAKEFKKAPPLIAKEIVDNFPTSEFVDKIENVNAYINIYLNKSWLVEQILSPILTEKENYGFDNSKSKGNIVIDFSSPNIAKPFHIGHLRSTVIGNSLYKIFEALGYNCHGVNHLGDWGTQFGKLMVAYKNYSSKEIIEEKGIEELLRIYVKFHEEAKLNPELDDEARSYFTKMEKGDEEALELWKWFKEISLNEFERVYKILDVTFDSYNGEAFYNDKMTPVIEELEAKNLIEISEGAKLVRLEEDNMPPCLITKNDGSTLYATRDITAAKYRYDTYNFEKSIYVTALQQNLHFAQVFKVVDKMGYPWANKMVHVPFGMVSGEGGQSLSTRNGNILFLEDILTEAIEKTKSIIEEKNPTLQNKDEVARQVGVGAIIFNDMYNSIIKDVIFSWEQVLNFEGETGPNVQYAHARACSVLRQANLTTPYEKIDFSLLNDEASINLAKELGKFKSVIRLAGQKFEPSFIARYAVDVAQAFNKFYHDNTILVENASLKEARLNMVLATKYTLKNALYLLGIKSPEQM
ncbi:MAG: arginine--tRNA ligase [Epulopiscium sp. Nele67-Bin005]|nr:MAG: arginine--tRNA ligase [Epulopiscium sp. Nele67-Bin005]